MAEMKITKEQEKALKRLLHEWEVPRREIIEKSIKGGWISPNLSQLNDFTHEEIALLLCGWYEVEQPFKVGDWVVDEGLNRVGKLEHYNEDTFIVEWVTGTESYYKHKSLLIRHATPEEIAQEKERRRWAEFGRNPDEYGLGDIVKIKGSVGVQVIIDTINDGWELSGSVGTIYNDQITLVCPVEWRMDT